MIYSRALMIGLIGGLSGLVASCGTFVPGLEEVYDAQTTQNMVDAIVSHVQCEVQSQIQFIILDDLDRTRLIDPKTRQAYKRALDWLESWAAQATLTLTVDEKTTLNPGVTLNKVLPNAVVPFRNGNVTSPQSFNLGIGASASADATRKEVLSWYINFKNFLTPKKLAIARRERDRLYEQARDASSPEIASSCSNQNGILIEGDLKLREWIYAVLRPAFVEGGIAGEYAASLKDEAKASKKDVISHQITFLIQYSGNVTPTWKLVRISVNPSSPLFNAQRSRTQDLVVTMGPATEDGKLAQQAQNQALAAAIGTAVANAIRNGP
jgi:hypothetical protein